MTLFRFIPDAKIPSLTFSLPSPPASRSSFLPAFPMCWISATASSIFPLFLQLCEYFNIPLQTVNRVSRNYVNQILHTVKTSETYYTNYVQTEQLMQVILFSLPIGICLFGADGRIQFMNAKFAHAFSLPSSNFEGQPFSECLPPAYADTAFDRNGDWTILLSDQKNTDHVKRSLYGFSGYRTCFSCVSSREQIHGNVGIKRRKKRKKSTFFASSRTFSLSLSHADSVQNLMAQARHLALFDFPILIQGESGTQRRTLARAIHNFFAPPSLSVFPFFILREMI